MLKNKTKYLLLAASIIVVFFVFNNHEPVNSNASAQIQPSSVPIKPDTIESVIKKIDTTNKVITIAKIKNKREKIIYRNNTPVLIVSASSAKLAKISDLKINDKITIFIGLHPTRSEYYLAGLIIRVDAPVKTTKKTITTKVVATKTPSPTIKKTITKTTSKTTASKPTVKLLTTPIATSTPPTAPAPKSTSTAFVSTTAPTPTTTTSTQPTPTPTPPAPLVLASSACAPLPAPTGATVIVSNWQELKTAVKNANENNGNVTILLNDGEYLAEHFLFIYAPNVAIRGKSGDRDKVTIKSPKMKGGASHIFGVIGDNITIADMSIGQVANHVIQVFGEKDADNLLVHNVRFFDSYEQLLKVSVDNKHKEIKPENGVVECSLFEYTAGVGPQWYIGGIDAHNAQNWIVRDNVFRNIISPTSDWAEHAIHFWNDSAGTFVDRNIIINSDRGIGFGLGEAKHTGGIIRNNMIYHNAKKGDVGIGLENASGAKVYNNTIFFEHNYPNAIEYRFAGTSAEIYNNLTNKKIQKREGNPVGDLQNNFTDALAQWFVNPSAGNLRLAQKREELVERGKAIDSVKTDIDGQNRPQGSGYDIGADEWK